MFMYLLESAIIMFLSLIRYELLSFEHGNPISHIMYNIILLLFVRIQSSFFQPEVLHFLSIYFHALCPYLESLNCFHGKDLIVKSSIFVCTENQDGSKLTFTPFEIVSICVWHFLRNISYCSLFTFT